MELTNNQVLQYALTNGMIDIGIVREQIEMNERKRYLEMHKYETWKGSDGKYHTNVPDSTKPNGRRSIKRSTEKSLEDAIIDFYKEQENEPYIKEVFYMWINSKVEYGEITRQTYDKYENDFFRFFKDSNLYNTKFKYITDEMLEHFIKDSIHKKQLTAKAWSNLRTLINGIFKYAKKKGYTGISITQFIGDLDISKKAFKKVIKRDEESVFTDKEIDLIVKYINSNEPSIINLGVILAFQVGLRAGELSALKYTDLSGNILTVSKTEIRYKDQEGHYVFDVRESTKGDIGIRKVVLTDFAIKTIKQIKLMNPFGEYLFMQDGQRVKGKAFTVKLEKICKYVGITPRSLHKARKTYATKLLNAGLDEKLIQNQMGHTDISTTKGFYWYNNKDTEEIKKLISSVIM